MTKIEQILALQSALCWVDEYEATGICNEVGELLGKIQQLYGDELNSLYPYAEQYLEAQQNALKKLIADEHQFPINNKRWYQHEDNANE